MCTVMHVPFCFRVSEVFISRFRTLDEAEIDATLTAISDRDHDDDEDA